MRYIQVNELPNLIMDRLGLVLFEDLYQMMHFDPAKQVRTFSQVLKNSLVEYARYYPVQMKMQLSFSKTFNFDQYAKDNHRTFADYLNGDVEDENNIILHPTVLYFVKNGTFLNAQWWDYQTNTGELRSRYGKLGNCYVEYAAQYPFVLKEDCGCIDPMHRFTDDSRIYYLDIHTDTVFLDFLIFYVIRQIRILNSSVNLNTPVNLLTGIDTQYTEFETLVNNHKEFRSDIIRMWRK